MKGDQKAEYISIFFNHLGIVTVLLLGVICICTIFGLVNLQSFRLVANQRQWKVSKPSAYYMQVSEARPDGGPWRWEVYVQGGRLVTVTVLHTNKQSNSKSWLDPTNLTVEQIFSLADRSCANRGVWNCGLKFDSQFHYLKQVVSYEMMIIEVEQFVPCEQTLTDCLTELQVPP